MATLFKISSGLLLREDWSAPSGWTTAAAGWSDVYNPGFVSFGHTPIVALAPSPSPGLDHGGCREVTMYVENGVWYLIYSAGDGTAAATGNWRPQMATSSSEGLVWERKGYILGTAGLAIGGTETALTYRDLGFFYKLGSTYVLCSTYGDPADVPVADRPRSVAPANGLGLIPKFPYPTDVWTATSPFGPWTYSSATPAFGAAGSFDEAAALTYCVVNDGTTLWAFYVSCYVPYGAMLNVGLATSLVANPAGPWTKYPGGAILPAANASVNTVENPRVWAWPQLGCYVMTINGRYGLTTGGSTPINLYWLNKSLTDWSYPIEEAFTFQHVLGAAKDQAVLDGSNNVGVLSPFYGPGAIPIIDDNGYMPACYDVGGDELWSAANANEHVNRSVYYTVLEPSPYCLKYTWGGGADVANRAQKSVVHTNFVAEFAVDYVLASGSGVVAVGFDYRIQASGDSYRMFVAPAGKAVLQKSTGGSAGVPGSYSTLASASGVMTMAANQSTRIRISVVGNLHDVYLDGEHQITYTDSSSPYTTGTAVALMAGGLTARFRLVHMRTGNVVTVNGLSDGDVITFRAAGGIPVENAIVEGTSYTTSTITHYPIDTITHNGTDYPFTSQGLIWGGDVLTFPVDPATLYTHVGWSGLSRTR